VDPKRTPKAGSNPLRPQSSPLQPVKPGVQRPAFGEALDQLGRDIQQLRVDYERFFSGALPVPPEELRARVQGQIRHLRGQSLLSAVDSFRLGDFEARFSSYNELFNRRLRDLEEGRQPAARQAPPPAPKRYDPEKGVVFSERVDPEGVEALYQGLASAPGEAPRFDLDSFQTYLTRQVAAIRDKTGCSQVQFRLATEDGKVKLKARPVVSK
jgi:hypothetical protein